MNQAVSLLVNAFVNFHFCLHVFVCVSVHTHTGMEHLWRSEENNGPLFASYLVRIRVSSDSSPDTRLADPPASREPLGSASSPAPGALGLQMCAVVSDCMWVLGIKTQLNSRD